MKTKLVLENGTVFAEEPPRNAVEITGEIVLNTDITGYQEVLTDLSYAGQIFTMIYPLAGNYGLNPDDYESVKPQVAGIVVKEISKFPSNFRATESFKDCLIRYNIVGIQNIDTRMLTRIIRSVGAIRGIISTIDMDEESLLTKVKQSPQMLGLNLVTCVSTDNPYRWDKVDETQFALKLSVNENYRKEYR